MHALGQYLLRAYRPLYLHGQWRDGPYRWPSAPPPIDATAAGPVSRPGSFVLRATRLGSALHIFHPRSRP